MVKIAVFVSGGGTNLQSLIDHRFENGSIELVISNRESAYGLKRARNAGIKAIFEKDQNKILEILKENEIDLIVLAGYLAIISDELIKEYENRIINIHPSLIPSFCGKGYYGLHVHEKAFERGVKVSGPTVHFVNGVVDGGPIILQKAIDVSAAKSPEEMQQMVLVLEHEILPKAVELYCDNKLEIVEGRVIINEKSANFSNR